MECRHRWSHDFDHDPPLCTSRGSHLDYSPGVQGSRYAYPHVCSNNWEAIRVPRDNPQRGSKFNLPLSEPIGPDKDLRRRFVARCRNRFAIVCPDSVNVIVPAGSSTILFFPILVFKSCSPFAFSRRRFARARLKPRANCVAIRLGSLFGKYRC